MLGFVKIKLIYIQCFTINNLLTSSNLNSMVSKLYQRFHLHSSFLPSGMTLTANLINLIASQKQISNCNHKKQNYITMQKEKRQIRLEDFEIEYKLGEGAYGYVFLASRNCQEYAIKQMSKHRLKKSQCQHLPLVEKQVLRLANHPGIIKSHFAFQSSSKLYLALQVCQGGRIEDLVHDKMLSQEARRFYMAELVDILDYLHSKGIVHRDLKPSNIMLSKEHHIKLIDFGTACVENSTLVSSAFKEKLAAFKGKDHNKQNQKEEQSKKGQRIHRRKSSFVGTSAYVSPQLLQFNECECTADLWALGCILYFLYYGESPFYDVCELQLYHHIKEAQIVFPENEQLNEEAKDLIKRLLVKDPNERLGSCSRQELSFAALKKHPYISKFDYDNLFQTQPPQLENQLAKLQNQIQKMSLTEKSPFGENFGQKLFIKHTEDRGDVICNLSLGGDYTLEQTEVGDSPIRKVYKLQSGFENKVAHQLSQMRFSVGVQGGQRIIYTSTDAKDICQHLNNLAEKSKEKQSCFCLLIIQTTLYLQLSNTITKTIL